MSRSRRPAKRKGCVGCYDDGFATVNRRGLCRQCQAKLNKTKPARSEGGEGT